MAFFSLSNEINCCFPLLFFLYKMFEIVNPSMDHLLFNRDLLRIFLAKFIQILCNVADREKISKFKLIWVTNFKNSIIIIEKIFKNFPQVCKSPDFGNNQVLKRV